jgi:hypothetical protein
MPRSFGPTSPSTRASSIRCVQRVSSSPRCRRDSARAGDPTHVSQVEQLLLDDPSNEEYRDIYDSLAEASLGS